MKATLQPGCSFLIRRPVSTMGVRAMLMQSACCGNSRFAITDQAGQQEVPMKGRRSGTSLRKSSASWMVHRSAPMATSTTSWKPRALKAARIFSGVSSLPNCPAMAGAMAAYTGVSLRIAWMH